MYYILRRLGLISAVLFLLWGDSVLASHPNVIYYEGSLFYLNQEQQFVPLQHGKLTDDSSIRIGQKEDLTIPEPPVTAPFLSSLRQSLIVLRHSKREMLTFLKGSTLQRHTGDDRIPSYELSGIGHIFIDESENLEPFEFRVNNLHLQANQQTHLFFNGLVSPQELMVVKGNILELPYALDPTEDEVNILLKKDTPIPGMYKRTLVPGFFTPGPYIYAGTAEINEGALTLYRYGQKYQLTGKSIPLMVHDRVETGPKQILKMVLISGDQIRLFGNSRFTIVEVDEQDITPHSMFGKIWKDLRKPKKQYSFKSKFEGRIQSIISPRKVKGIVRFQTHAAAIGVKGTEFIAVSTPGLTEVATLSGTLLVSDPDGAGVVELVKGMMTKVVKGTMPTPPVPTPPNFLQAPQGSVNVKTDSEGDSVESQEQEQFKKNLPLAILSPLYIQGNISIDEQKQYYNALYKTVSKQYNVISQSDFQKALAALNQTYETPKFMRCQSIECLQRLKTALKVKEVFILSALRDTGDTKIRFKRLNTKKVYTNDCEICLPREVSRRIPYVVRQLLRDLELESSNLEP